MWNLQYDTNESAQQKQTHKQDRFVVATGEGLAHGWRRRLGLADVSCNIQNG